MMFTAASESKRRDPGRSVSSRKEAAPSSAPWLQNSASNRALFRLLRTPARSAAVVQRKCACDGSPDKCPSCSGANDLQRVAPASHAPATAPPIVHQSLQTPGRPLDSSIRTFFEPRFGRDLGTVRVHTDSIAAASARAVNALAYTVGRDVVFGAGQFAPHTSQGRRVLAHELAHTVQQSAGGDSQRVAPLRISDPADAAEREASDIADRVMVGGGVGPLELASAGVLHRVPPEDAKKQTPADELEDPFAIQCPAIPEGKWITQVVVNQEAQQTVTATWNDGSTSSGECSTGKGHCCVDPANPTGVACTEARSRTYGSNCTPITTGKGLPVLRKQKDHKGVQLWTEIDSTRAIALHAYSPINGHPLSHGCVRLHDDMACNIFNGSRVGKTMVQIKGFARPMCDDTTLQAEWQHDFDKGGKGMSKADGDEKAEIAETRTELNAAFGRTLKPEEIRGFTAKDIPKCTATRPLPAAPVPPATPATPPAAPSKELEF
jgi:hypothetical protein